jgi:hypothetical protein
LAVLQHEQTLAREAAGRTGKGEGEIAVEIAVEPDGVTDRMLMAVYPRGSDSMLVHFVRVGLFTALLSSLLIGCVTESPETSQRILGRWEVIQMEGIHVPNSFFWFTMDAIEFREDGEVWALMHDPSGTDDLRLNKTAAYSLVGDDQIEFVGACRHEDPCTGVYTLSLKGDDVQILDAEGRLELRRAGPPSRDRPPKVVGPSASATPAAPQ